MFIAVDGLTANVPNDVKALVSSLKHTSNSAGSGAVAFALETPSKELMVLDRWDVQSHQYKTDVDVKTSLVSRLFSANADVSHFGLVQEAKRYCIQSTDDTNRKVEFGVAVRLSVAVLDSKFNAELTLPAIAATAQLTDLRARIALSVDGYIGPLGEMLPAPDNLNVENLAVYTDAFKSIQALVFGQDGMDHLYPTLLGYEADKAAS